MITVENREEIITLGELFEVIENVKNFLNSRDTQEKSLLLKAILYDLAN